MNVWIINHYSIPPSMGGLVRHYYFAKYMKQNDYNVRIFTSSKIHNSDVNMINDKSLYKEKVVDNMEYTFIKTLDYKGNGIARICNILQFALRICRVYKKFEKPDIIYASSPDLFTVLSAVVLSKKLKVKVIVEIRDLWPESIIEYNKISKKNIIIKILYKLEKWIYKNADKLIFTMEGGKDYIVDKGWNKAVDLSKIRHINNGVDIDEFQYNREYYSIDDDDLDNEKIFKVIYTGSIRKANGLDIILKAAKCIENEGYDKIKIIIYGEGTERKKLIDICKAQNINNICFKGHVDKKYISYILSKADLNLCHWQQTNIMRYGCSSNKLFDYLASGKPILSDVVVGYDLIDKYKTGITLQSQEPIEIAKAIIDFYKLSNEKYNDMCESAIMVAMKYDYKRLSNKLMIIIERLVNMNC